jgi:hypothetical protein
MKKSTAVFFIGALAVAFASCRAPRTQTGRDWLIDPGPFKAAITKTADGISVVLENGLIARTIRLAPNAATVDFQNLATGEAVIRAVRPEAILEIDGKKYKVGGLEGQPDQAYILPQWLETLRANPDAFTFAGLDIGETEARFPYKRVRWSADLPWPPPGKSLILHFTNEDPRLRGVGVDVHYEIYDGLPLLSKWVVLRNASARSVRVDSFISETLAVVEPEISVGDVDSWDRPNIQIETDYAFNGMSPKSASRSVYWVADPTFTSQVNYSFKTPCVLECRPPLGPSALVAPGADFETFRTFELVYDSTDRERKGLSLRRMYRTIAPWVTENPIFLHLKSTDPAIVRQVVDQCAAVGFEMVILSFGSGLNMENIDDTYLAGMKDMVGYARAKGIELGGYSLLASRHIDDADDVINPKTGKPGDAIFGNSPCLGSPWGRDYFRRITTFIEKTGFSLLEHDGSYPGDVCASTSHPGHKGLDDSQWTQWSAIADFYKWCRARGVYLNVPDWYFLNGSNKTGIGYREVNWSLPRDRQILLGRQNLYDGTWEKTPSMGWTFVPLVQYQGGGAAATLEPLAEHLDAYEAHLAQNFGYGVQACYRGTRLYDTDATKTLVKSWVEWAKKFRAILNSDIIHIRRTDGRDLDAVLHVNPHLKEKGLLMVFNPTEKEITRTLLLPLYYTGLTDIAAVRAHDGAKKTIKLDREYKIPLTVKVPARGFTWFVIE